MVARVAGPDDHRPELEQLPGLRARIGKTGRATVVEPREGGAHGRAARRRDRCVERVVGSGGATGRETGALSEHGGGAGRAGGAPAGPAADGAAPGDGRRSDGRPRTWGGRGPGERRPLGGGGEPAAGAGFRALS